MAGLFGVGGSAAKTDRSQQLKSWGDLNQLFGFGSKTGKAQTTEGGAGLTKARNYFDSLAGGDRAKMSNVLAPQISTIKGQSAEKLKTASEFDNRSGGTNAVIQASEQEANNAVQQMFELLGPEAMKEVAAISGTQEALGQNLLSEAGTAAAEAGAQATGSRQQTLPQQQEQQAAAIQAIGALFGL